MYRRFLHQIFNKLGKIILAFLSFVTFFCITGCSSAPCRNSSPDADTLKVGYTYWWPGGGPFTGLCGNPYSVVFTGTVVRIDAPRGPYPSGRNAGEVLYNPQNGVISIDHVILSCPPAHECNDTSVHAYSGEKWLTSDCFYGSNLHVGDKVMVFLYSYEEDYCIPSNSIIKIENEDDPAVISIKKYIKHDQDPLSISSDTVLWKKYGFDDELKQIIECKQYSLRKNK